MKKKKLLPWLPVAVCCCAFAVYFVSTRGMTDHTPPEITVPESTLEVDASADEKELLRGITAWDERSGDVTDSLVVESVSAVYDGNRATVTYAAFDEAGNVSKAQRPVRYENYVGPRLTFSQPLLFWAGESVDVFDRAGATDKRDGSLNGHVKATLVEGGSMDKPGTYQVEFRVTNSLGDTERLVLPVEILEDEAPERTPHLKKYLLYLSQGDDFDAMDYVKADTRGWPMKVVTDLDTHKPGVYTVDYEDKNGAYFGRTRLIVVVEG